MAIEDVIVLVEEFKNHVGTETAFQLTTIEEHSKSRTYSQKSSAECYAVLREDICV